jgi:tetratricopeptide (TPR) repeat protein
VLSATELHERALRASNAGRHGSARRLLDTAGARTADAETGARIALSVAYLDAEHGRVNEGLRSCEEALGYEGTTARTRGLVLAQRGLLLMRAGDVPAALDSFSTAQTLLTGPDSRQELARLRLNRGNAYLQGGDLECARRDFESCIDLLSTELPLTAARARHNLGYVHLLQGDLISALRRMEEARPVLAPVSAVSRAVGAQDRAEVLLAAGLVDEAVGALREAVAAFGARGLRQQQGEAELVLARTLSRTGRSAEARAVARRAMRRFERRGAATWALRAEVVSLTVDPAPPPTAASRLCEVSAKLAEAGLRTEALTAEQSAARALVRAGDLDAACELASHRLPSSAAPVQRIGRSLLRAELAQRAGRSGAARRSLREGLDALDAWQTTFGSLDLQTALSGHGRALAELGLRLALADGRPAVVLEWVERARALAARVTSVRPPADPAVAEDLAALRSLGEEEPVATARLQERVRAQAWLGTGAAQQSPPATLDRVQEALAERDGTLVAHLVLDGQVSALVVTAASAAVHPLASQVGVDTLLRGLQADLDVAASRLQRAMRQVVRSSLDRRLAALSQQLWTGLPQVASGRSCWSRRAPWPRSRGPACRRCRSARSRWPGPPRAGWRRATHPGLGEWVSWPVPMSPGRSRRSTTRARPGGGAGADRPCCHRLGGEPAGSRRGPAARRRPRPSQRRQPAVLRPRAGRRHLARLRHRPAAASAAAGRPVRVRARSLGGALGCGDPRRHRGLAARRRRLRDRLAHPGRRRRRL